ncbi:ROK family protein [Flavisolibacter ginsenosidimutans]|uniref:ROK family protein n=1 Tax=Flavisolibacter ginsenosidimutans TaxID=661481 RepID=A0A5B8UD56_9BACT|nr:ROK family protein [Flavisolibacter ginsenosidimutans]QEC54428.1 ROK family protein [Flavisolibacter ginsenosidimutans]
MAKKAAYKRNIIKQLYFGSPLSCADISVLTDKSLPVAAKVLNELIEEGSVVETGYASSTGGRRPATYSLRPDLMYVVSVAMDQLICRMAVVNMHNQIVGDVEKIELTLPNNPNSLKELKEHLQNFIANAGVPKEKIAGVGIGMPGFVDVKKGVNHSFLKSNEGDIVSFLEAGLDLPVVIDNDSSLIALAELRLGAARNKETAMVINISWGVGLGMILNGKLFRGFNGFAGEFSHIPLFTNNKMCSCGKSGCLETETSLLVIVEKARQGINAGKLTGLKNLSFEHPEETANAIIEAAVKGDKFAVELFSEIGYNIGRGVAILIHLLNPELVVLSGRGSGAGKLWLAPIQQAINEHCIPKIAENTTVQVSVLGHQAEIIGAAALVMENFDSLNTLPDKSSVDHLLA